MIGMSNARRRISDLAAAVLCCCGLLILLAGCAAGAGGGANPLFSAPISIDSEDRPVIDVVVGGEAFKFVLDTASTRSALSRTALERLGAPLTPKASVRILGITGAATAPTAVLPRVTIGPEAFDDVRAVIIDEWLSESAQPDGIVGLDLLARYFIVVDPQRKAVDFHDGAASPPRFVSRWKRTSLDRIPFDENVREGLSGRLYALQGRINLEKAPMLVDTGAAISIANRPFVDVVWVADPAYAGRARRPENREAVGGAVGEDAAVDHLVIYGVAAGEIRWRADGIRVLDAPIFADLGYAAAPMAIIGWDILSQSPFAVDFARNTLYAAPD